MALPALRCTIRGGTLVTAEGFLSENAWGLHAVSSERAVALVDGDATASSGSPT